MKRSKLVLGLICALAALGATAGTASANTICNGPAPLRSAPNPSSPIYGWMPNGSTFQVWSPAAGNFYHGYSFALLSSGYANGNYLC